jgi:hypothetical protein
MKVALACLVFLFIGQSAAGVCVQFSGHKSEDEIARMTPLQRVEEFCREYVRHGYRDSDYGDLLDSYISRDGVKALPPIIKIIEEYDPTRPGGSGKQKSERCDAVIGLLPKMDANVVRLRALPEGIQAMDAMGRLAERMRGAHFDIAEPDDYNQSRYKVLISDLNEIEGINYCDLAIRNTLKLKYKISLSDRDLLDFVSYLISLDPYYPGWSEREEFKDLTEKNKAGNPLWYVIVKKSQPFYDAYLKYKANNR